MDRDRQGCESSGPATLGSTLAAHLRLIAWCNACGHQAEPDVAQLVERYGGDLFGDRAPDAGVEHGGYLDAPARGEIEFVEDRLGQPDRVFLFQVWRRPPLPATRSDNARYFAGVFFSDFGCFGFLASRFDRFCPLAMISSL